ncbi:hypothetical protein FSA03_11465 [Bacteroides fragilis]|uniref:Transmembrane protein n=1 Tax=Bacteroides fragilis TaxID=817 RepID=A0AB38PSX4_BACFG|nr:hypothetical protein F9Z90_14440 [Bacteroides fragilis]TWV43071.1 hypothetical protein FSA06_05580 [Bacteroides fragilis]TWV49158.1 hypothetical protein FSA03_11465 [Bacteroides fragilis]
MKREVEKHPHVLDNNIPMFYLKTSGCCCVKHPDVFIPLFYSYHLWKMKRLLLSYLVLLSIQVLFVTFVHFENIK